MGNRLHNAKNYKTQFGCYIDNDGKLRLKLGEVENYKGIWSNGDKIFINDIVYIVDNNLQKYYIAIHNLQSSLESPLTDTNNFSEFFECPISSGGGGTTLYRHNMMLSNEQTGICEIDICIITDVATPFTNYMDIQNCILFHTYNIYRTYGGNALIISGDANCIYLWELSVDTGTVIFNRFDSYSEETYPIIDTVTKL